MPCNYLHSWIYVMYSLHSFPHFFFFFFFIGPGFQSPLDTCARLKLFLKSHSFLECLTFYSTFWWFCIWEILFTSYSSVKKMSSEWLKLGIAYYPLYLICTPQSGLSFSMCLSYKRGSANFQWWWWWGMILAWTILPTNLVFDNHFNFLFNKSFIWVPMTSKIIWL